MNIDTNQAYHRDDDNDDDGDDDADNWDNDINREDKYILAHETNQNEFDILNKDEGLVKLSLDQVTQTLIINNLITTKKKTNY